MVKRVALASFGLLSILALAFFEPSGHPFAYFSSKNGERSDPPASPSWSTR